MLDGALPAMIDEVLVPAAQIETTALRRTRLSDSKRAMASATSPLVLIRRVAPPAIALIVIAYFLGAAVFGDNGVMSWGEYRRQKVERDAMLTQLKADSGYVDGILGPVGFYRRSVFVIDREGVVRWAHRATAGLTFRPVDEIVDAVRAIPG